MGRKNVKGSISIIQDGKRIRLRWRYQQKRYSLNLFSFTKAILLQAKSVAVEIERDILAGDFDQTLMRYKPAAAQETLLPVNKPLVDHFEEWVRNYRNMDCDRDIDYQSTRSMMKQWGRWDESTVVQHYSKEAIGARTYNRRLTLLKSFFQRTLKCRITQQNPLEDVLPRKSKSGEKPNRKPFTEDEIKRIFYAVNNDTFCTCTNFKYSHYYPFLYFIFATDT